MTHAFSELVIGGVLVSPFITYAVMALVIFLLLRPILRLAGSKRCSAIRRSRSSVSMWRSSGCSR